MDRYPNRLRELREAAGLTVEAVAHRVIITEQQVRNHECGRTPLSGHWIETYARLYKVRTDEVFLPPRSPNGRVAEPAELQLTTA